VFVEVVWGRSLVFGVEEQLERRRFVRIVLEQWVWVLVERSFGYRILMNKLWLVQQLEIRKTKTDFRENLDMKFNKPYGVACWSGQLQAFSISSQIVPPGHDSTNINSLSHMMNPFLLTAKGCGMSVPLHGLGRTKINLLVFDFFLIQSIRLYLVEHWDHKQDLLGRCKCMEEQHPNGMIGI